MASTIPFPLPGTFFLSVIHCLPLSILQIYDSLSSFEDFIISNINSDHFFLVPSFTSIMYSDIYLTVFWLLSAFFTNCKLQSAETTSVLTITVSLETSVRCLVYDRWLMSICWMNHYVNFVIKMDHNDSLFCIQPTILVDCVKNVVLQSWRWLRLRLGFDPMVEVGRPGGDHCASLGDIDGVLFAIPFLGNS